MPTPPGWAEARDHALHRDRVNALTTCTPHHRNETGECFNCGFIPADKHDSDCILFCPLPDLGEDICRRLHACAYCARETAGIA